MSRTSLALIAALLIAPSAAHALTVIGDGRIEITFTTPGMSAETALDPETDDAVIALVDGAAATLDVRLYDFNHPGIIAAITAAADRGVAVRFVGDADEADQDGYVAMSAAGIPTTLRVGGAIMHNKFLVVDGRFVATGSMNHSDAGVFRNNNNLVVFDDAILAADYTAELEQMFIGGAFGRNKVSFAHPAITLGQTQVQVAFSLADDPELILRDALATADPNGTDLGQEYVVLANLGDGGFGKVYLALQMPVRLRAALKLLHRDARDPDVARAMVQKFFGEAQALAALAPVVVAEPLARSQAFEVEGRRVVEDSLVVQRAGLLRAAWRGTVIGVARTCTDAPASSAKGARIDQSRFDVGAGFPEPSDDVSFRNAPELSAAPECAGYGADLGRDGIPRHLEPEPREPTSP